MYCTPMEEKLLHALETMLAWAEKDSQLDLQTDPGLREEYFRQREQAAATALEARAQFTGKAGL